MITSWVVFLWTNNMLPCQQSLQCARLNQRKCNGAACVHTCNAIVLETKAWQTGVYRQLTSMPKIDSQQIGLCRLLAMMRMTKEWRCTLTKTSRLCVPSFWSGQMATSPKSANNAWTMVLLTLRWASVSVAFSKVCKRIIFKIIQVFKYLYYSTIKYTILLVCYWFMLQPANAWVCHYIQHRYCYFVVAWWSTYYLWLSVAVGCMSTVINNLILK